MKKMAKKRNIFSRNTKKKFIKMLKYWLDKEECLEGKLESEDRKHEISSLISLDIIRHGRPFCDGNFIQNIITNVMNKLDYNGSFIKSIPLSRYTVARRCIQLGGYTESAIKEKLASCEAFSISFYESADINDLCQLVICVRCVDVEYNVFETMFSLETFYGNVTGKLLFDVVKDKFFSFVDSKKLAGICTDGAAVMCGENEGFKGQLMKHGYEFSSFHCIIHQVALASKFLSEHAAMKAAEEIIGIIRGGQKATSLKNTTNF